MFSRKQEYRIKAYGKPSQNIVFFFCPFGVRRWQLQLPFLPISSLVKAGFQVVCYDFNTRAITANPRATKRILDEVLVDVKEKIKEYKSNGVKDVAMFGASMGTLIAAYCAAKTTETSKLVLNLSYGDAVDHISSLPGMLLLPASRVNKYIELAGGKDKLRNLFKGYSPLDNLAELEKKKVLLYLSKKDRVLNYDNSYRLKQRLETSGNLRYVENNKLGHYWTATFNHFKRSVYLDFLKS